MISIVSWSYGCILLRDQVYFTSIFVEQCLRTALNRIPVNLGTMSPCFTVCVIREGVLGVAGAIVEGEPW